MTAVDKSQYQIGVDWDSVLALVISTYCGTLAPLPQYHRLNYVFSNKHVFKF